MSVQVFWVKLEPNFCSLCFGSCGFWNISMHQHLGKKFTYDKCHKKRSLIYRCYKGLITGTFDLVKEAESLSGSGPWAQMWGRDNYWLPRERRESSPSSGKHMQRRCWGRKHNGPGWCGSVNWAPACKPKVCQFDSQPGHMPGLQARSPVRGVREPTNQCFYPSLSPSLPLCLKINK